MSRPALLEGNPAHQPRNSDLTIGVPHVGPSDRERGWRGLGCPLGTHGRRHHLRSGSDEPDGANGTRAKALYFTSGETGPAVILVHGSLPGSSGRARWRCIAPFLSSRTMARTHRQSHPALIATDSKSGLFGTRVILAIWGPSCSTQNRTMMVRSSRELTPRFVEQRCHRPVTPESGSVTSLRRRGRRASRWLAPSRSRGPVGLSRDRPRRVAVEALRHLPASGVDLVEDCAPARCQHD